MNKRLDLISKVTNDYNLALKYEFLESINDDKDRNNADLADSQSDNPLDWKSFNDEDHYFVVLSHNLPKLYKYPWIKKMHPKAFDVGNAKGALSKDLNELRKRLIARLLTYSYRQIQQKTLDDIHQIKYIHRKSFEQHEEVYDSKANSLIDNKLRTDITALDDTYDNDPKIVQTYRSLSWHGYDPQLILKLQGLVTILNG